MALYDDVISLARPNQRSQVREANGDVSSDVSTLSAGYRRPCFVSDLPSKYICPVCTAVATEPHQVTCCGSVICLSCVNSLKQNGPYFKCPACQEENVYGHFVDKRMMKELSSFEVYCTNGNGGCTWQGELGTLEGHLVRCTHQIIACTGNCGEELKRCNLKDHLEYHCRNRPSTCPHCNTTGTYAEISRLHLDNCPHMVVQCTNEECKEMLKRSELENHLSQKCLFQVVPCTNNCGKEMQRASLSKHINKGCHKRQHTCPDCGAIGVYEFIVSKFHTDKCPDRVVQCPNAECEEVMKQGEVDVHRMMFCPKEQVRCGYSSVGCLEVVPRDKLLQHSQKNVHKHLNMAMLKIKENHEELRAEVAKLTSTVSLLEAKVGKSKTLIKFDKVKECEEANTTWLSTGFYTSASGYKMRLKVSFTDDTAATHEYLSSFILLIPGEYDTTLEWPFKGEVTIELLNQLEDKNHYKRVIQFDDSIPMKCRCQPKTSSTEGWGFQMFIPRSDLAYNPSKKCQHLLDDSLYFRISSSIKSKGKPWLCGYAQ